MFKDLFQNRLLIVGLAFFVLCVVGSLLYMQHVEKQSARELAETQERIKKLTEKPPTTAQAPVGETSQGGHFHADGTWHEGPHDPPVRSTPAQLREPLPVQTLNASQVQQVSKQRMLPEDILSPEYIAMVKKAVQTSIALFDKRTEDGLTVPEFTRARNLVKEAMGDASRFRQMYYDDTLNNRAYLDKCYQIEALDDPYGEFVDARYPKPKLNSEQLSQLRKAADEFDALLPKNPIEPLPNPYRERLQEEENR